MLAPAKTKVQAPFYVLTFDDYATCAPGNRSTGTYELDFDRMTETMIARDILGGQFENIDRVYLATPDENLLRDVTEDIAFAVAQLAYAETSHPCADIRNWIESHIGCDKAARILPMEAA